MAAVSLLFAVAIALVGHGTIGRASGEMGGITTEFHTTLMYPCSGCFVSISGTSGGDVAGNDNGTAYEIAWPDNATTTNFSGTLYYTVSCNGSLPQSLSFDAASNITVNNAELAYGTLHEAATVRISFGAALSGDAVVVTSVTSMEITSSSKHFTVYPLSAGALDLTPTTPAGACLTGSQGYQLSGPLMTANT
jgi:hypothetical protein